ASIAEFPEIARGSGRRPGAQAGASSALVGPDPLRAGFARCPAGTAGPTFPSRNEDPLADDGAAGDGLADPGLLVAIGEGREGWGPRGSAVVEDPAVDVEEELLERVGEPLGVAAWVVADRGGGRAEQGGVALQELVGTPARADPELVGRLAVP